MCNVRAQPPAPRHVQATAVAACTRRAGAWRLSSNSHPRALAHTRNRPRPIDPKTNTPVPLFPTGTHADAAATHPAWIGTLA